MTDGLPPQAVEVEQAILGACLAFGATDRAIEALRSPEALYHRPHALILAACRDLAVAGNGVGTLIVAEELKRRGQLDAVGGPVYLAELAACSDGGANVRHHCRIVLRTARLRGILEAAQEAVDRVYRAEHEPEAIIAGLEERLGAMEDGVAGGPRSLDGVVAETLDDLTYRQAHPGLAGVTTGLADLDAMTSGWIPGDLIVVGARPSMGKTGMALGAVQAAAAAGVPCLVYSLEMPARQLGQRLLSRVAKVDLHQLRTARLDDGQWQATSRAAEDLAALKVWVDDTAGLTVADIRARAARLARTEKIGLIAVDYLQLVAGSDSRDSQEREVARISRALKDTAKQLRVPVLALSQLSRAPEGRTDRRPQLSDLRYSGSIEQDADVVLLLYRPGHYGITQDNGQDVTGVAEIIIAKQRNGPVGVVKAYWDERTASYRDLATSRVVAQEPPQEEPPAWWEGR